ncbi:MAG: O-antigen ligase family protein [Alistipes sp.]
MTDQLTTKLYIIHSAALPLFYFIGKYLASKYRNQLSMSIILLAISIISALPHLYITITDVFSSGLINPERTISILDDDDSINVTLRVVFLSLSLGLFGIIVHRSQNKLEKKIKTIALAFAVMALLCVIHYVSRTGLTLLVASIIVGILYTRRLRTLSIFIMTIIIFIVVWQWQSIQTSELFSIYAEREIEGSSFQDAGGRVEIWQEFLSKISSHPFGGITSREYNYAHNLWLDITRIAGVIPFILLLLFSIINIRNLYTRCFKTQGYCLYKRILFLWGITFLLQLSIEPIFQGAPYYLMLYTLFCGIVNSATTHKVCNQQE